MAVYAGGNPNFDERTGKWRKGYTPPPKPKQKVFMGGSEDFDEFTGRYRSGKMPQKPKSVYEPNSVARAIQDALRKRGVR